MNKTDFLHLIEAPDLTDTNYGDNIKEQFKNINNNFSIVGNRGFVKGEQGDSIDIENITLSKSRGDIGYDLYYALKDKFEESFSTDELSKVNDFGWDDCVENFSIPFFVSKNSVTEEKCYIGSASVVTFFDNRFSKSALEKSDLSKYSNLTDVTSIILFKKYENKWNCELNFSFPRLKYENNSFYWVIGAEEETTIKATGIKGERGDNANTWIVETVEFDKSHENKPVAISNYFVKNDNGEYEWVQKVPSAMKDGDLAIVYCTTGNRTYEGFFISNIVKNEEDVTVYYNENIQHINYVKNTVEFFKSLGSLKGDKPSKGMFLKFYPDNDNDTKSHLISSNGNKLNVWPVSDYDPNVAPTEVDSASLNISYPETNVTSINTLYDNVNVKVNKSGVLLSAIHSSLSLDEPTVSSQIKLETSGTTIKNNLEIKDGGLIVSGKTTLNNELEVKDKITATNLVVSDKITASRNLEVANSCTLNNGVKVYNGRNFPNPIMCVNKHNDLTEVSDVTINGQRTWDNSTGTPHAVALEVKGCTNVLQSTGAAPTAIKAIAGSYNKSGEDKEYGKAIEAEGDVYIKGDLVITDGVISTESMYITYDPQADSNNPFYFQNSTHTTVLSNPERLFKSSNIHVNAKGYKNNPIEDLIIYASSISENYNNHIKYGVWYRFEIEADKNKLKSVRVGLYNKNLQQNSTTEHILNSTDGVNILKFMMCLVDERSLIIMCPTTSKTYYINN